MSGCERSMVEFVGGKCRENEDGRGKLRECETTFLASLNFSFSASKKTKIKLSKMKETVQFRFQHTRELSLYK